jgi:hypothetical protein
MLGSQTKELTRKDPRTGKPGLRDAQIHRLILESGMKPQGVGDFLITRKALDARRREARRKAYRVIRCTDERIPRDAGQMRPSWWIRGMNFLLMERIMLCYVAQQKGPEGCSFDVSDFEKRDR